MAGRALHQRLARFQEREVFVYALLGVVSYGRQLEHALAELAKPAAASTDAPPSWEVDLVLGIISLWQTSLAVLRSWAATRCVEPEPLSHDGGALAADLRGQVLR